MRKNILSLSIAAMIGGLTLAGGASATVVTAGTTATQLTVTPEGIGHILLVPYFTAQEGNSTLLNIVNTDETNGKAVKVRFRGASNSDDVFDFTLFLSPGDVWAGQVSKNATTGLAALSFGDASCTLPEGTNIKRDFVTARVNPNSVVANETREGYVEILNMADVPPMIGALANPLFTATKHVNDVAPCRTTTAGAAALNALKTEITNAADATAKGFTNPTTGLFANWTILNVPQASAWGGAATAVVAEVSAGVAGKGNIVVFPQLELTPIDAAASNTADPLLVTGAVAIKTYDLPDLSTPYLVGKTAVTQATELTASLAKTSIKNEYITSDSISASTDWVFSLPTRRYSVALNYAGTRGTAGQLTSAAMLFTTLTTNYFTTANTVVQGAKGYEQICVSGVTQYAYNREENKGQPDDFVISPSTPGNAPLLCGEAAVWSFNDKTGLSALGASVARGNLDTGTFGEGWAAFNTPGLAGVGLPVLGAAFIKAVSPGATAGTIGNFGANYDHRYSSAP